MAKHTIQIHEDALTKDDVVLIHDDLLATGTMCSIQPSEETQVKNIYINFLIELEDSGWAITLPGR